MYLELAEGENNGNYTALAQGGGVMDAYVFIPAGFLPEFEKDTYVRADYFNKFDPITAEALINALASQQTVGLSAIGIGAAFSGGLKFAKNLIEKRKAAVAAGTKKPIFGKGGVLQSIKDKIGKGGTMAPPVDPAAAAAEKAAAEAAAAAAAAAAAEQQKNFALNLQGQVNGQQFGVNYDPNAAQDQQQSFFAKNKTPLLIGGAVLLAGGIYLATKKKKK
jgi:LPXTG-motif cell wall-anchored protein